MTGDELLQRFPFLEPLGETDGTAQMYTGTGFRGRVGFISPVSRRFCASCNRMRLLSDGKVKPCLGDDTVYDLLPLVGDEARLTQEIRRIILQKPAGHRFGEIRPAHGLNRTGG